MANSGVNVDPLNPAGAPTPEALRNAGFSWVRLVSRPGVEDYVRACRTSGIDVLAVLARESFQNDTPHTLDPAPTVYQLGNEPDGEGPSSWRMTPEAYATLWNTYAGQLGAPVIAAGLCSGDPAGWIEPAVASLNPQPTALAVHPYGATDADATDLFESMARFGLPVWLTEWNPLPRDWTDPSAVSGLTSVWGVFDQQAQAAFWFCWSDGMVNGLGLLDATGQPKVQYSDLTALLRPALAVAADA